MKLKYTYRFDDNCMSHITIELDWKEVFSVHDSECSEDCNIGRNFSDCARVADLMKRAYELWKSWEELEIEYEEIGL